MQVGRGALGASSSFGRRPARVAERPRKLGTESDVIGTASPLEAVHTASVGRDRRRRGWRPTAAALRRGARAARLGDRLQHGCRRQREDERLFPTSCRHRATIQ